MVTHRSLSGSTLFYAVGSWMLISLLKISYLNNGKCIWVNDESMS